MSDFMNFSVYGLTLTQSAKNRPVFQPSGPRNALWSYGSKPIDHVLYSAPMVLPLNLCPEAISRGLRPSLIKLPDIFNVSSIMVDRHVVGGRGAGVAIECGNDKVTYRSD
jgi:hypothetical protein